MSQEFTYKFPHAGITADVIVYDERGDKILLLKRKYAPYKDCWAIVGGFFNTLTYDNTVEDKSVRAAAIREMKEEVNIDLESLKTGHDFSFVTIQDAPLRDPRGRTVTAVFALTLFWGIEKLDVKAQDDAAEVQWFPREDVLNGKVPLAFDHLDSIQKLFSNYEYGRGE